MSESGPASSPKSVTLPDGRTVQADPAATPFQIAEEHGLEGFKKAIAARLDGELTDLHFPLRRSGHLALVHEDDPDALQIIRHSTSHVLAQAVKQLYPETKIGQGPPTADGFYYDFGRETPFTDDDLEKIEKRMKKIVKRNLRIVRHEVPKKQAVEIFEEEQEPYKLYFVNTKSGATASYYEQGDFRDFCLGPHVPSTGRLGAFKLLNVAGAYWLGSEENEMLWRVYGTAFQDKEQLEAHLEKLAQARARDHRRLGKQLDLFSIQENAGGGLIFWHPNGATIRYQIETFLREELEATGYVFVYSPHIQKDTLFRTSGHYDYYYENMYTLKTADDEEFVVKPMNCPGHVQIFRSSLHSYRELPIRMAEFGAVHRYERSGTLHGLLRVRGFTQDDAHIFCRPDQLVDEVVGCLDLVDKVFRTFGFSGFRYELSVRDPDNKEKYAGTDEEWDAAEHALIKALELRELPHERYEGEAVFYGPKIDVKVVDALGRPWQLSTVQFDFNLPRRFEISYVDEDGQRKVPYMVHRAIYGSFERFFGILIEHFGGAFPPWLAPVQAKVLPVSDKVEEYARTVTEQLKAAGLRASMDERSDKIGAKIRDAEMAKVPYMLILGAREAEAGTVSLRVHHEGDQGSISVEEFVTRAKNAIDSRALTA